MFEKQNLMANNSNLIKWVLMYEREFQKRKEKRRESEKEAIFCVRVHLNLIKT